MANSLASGQKPTGVADLDSEQELKEKTLDSSCAINGAPVTGSKIINPTRLDVKKDELSKLQDYVSSQGEFAGNVIPSNGQLCFATDAKKMYQVLDGALAEVGSGQGGINYISNPDFELNAEGYTGDTNLTITRSTEEEDRLRGDASGVISKAAVDASGEVVKIPFTIESADLAKKLYISFDKDASDPNYADGDLRVEIIKDPNGTPVTIRCNAEDILGGKGSHLAWFQTDASILEYELVFKCNSSNASAYSVKIDNVSVGPREVSYGSAMTDWKIQPSPTIKGFTSDPTTGTVNYNELRTRRVGSNMEIIWRFEQTTAGTAGSSTYYIEIPENLSVDRSVLSATNSSGFENSIGYGFALSNGVAHDVTAQISDTNDNRIFFIYSNAGTNGGAWGSSVASLANSPNSISVQISVPIQGWSSNSIQSEDIGNREVRVRAAGNGGTAITANVTNIDFTEVEDTTNSWNGTQFTAPETGDYLISGGVAITTGLSLGIYAYLNNAIYKRIGNISSTSVGLFSVQANLVKGDTITIRFDVGATLTNSTNNHHIHIQKLAQPQTLLETETVAARYTSDSGQSITNSIATLIFEDKDYDTHNAYNTGTGEYIAPVTGIYSVKSAYEVIDNISTFQSYVIYVYVNGVVKARMLHPGVGVTQNYGVLVASDLSLNKGDILDIRTFNQAGTAALATFPERNYLSIARIK